VRKASNSKRLDFGPFMRARPKSRASKELDFLDQLAPQFGA
jgi:hypothetical protein